ncbi:MAG: membrane protein insertion efficiency factor YidD [Candidatus Omnitrophota bacterium]|nr:membrane protein insertion efficiency factor YidD [Candidatus Omnitrophota bacterium]
MKFVVIYALKFYRNYLSALKIRCCRFYPSCSEYAIGSIEKHGIFLGGVKSIWRLIRCNPFSRGGYDPVQ